MVSSSFLSGEWHALLVHWAVAYPAAEHHAEDHLEDLEGAGGGRKQTDTFSHEPATLLHSDVSLVESLKQGCPTQIHSWGSNFLNRQSRGANLDIYYEKISLQMEQSSEAFHKDPKQVLLQH